MTTKEAFDLMNNLDLPDGLRRKFGPKYSLLLIDRTGEVVRVVKFKSLPTEAEQAAIMNLEHRCLGIDGSPGMYETVEALQERIAGSM